MSRLPARVSSVPAARALAAAVCARWRIPTEAAQRAQAIITELATNVVQAALSQAPWAASVPAAHGLSTAGSAM